MAKRLRITGRVQGIGFRFSMWRKAEELGVTGWVRNCRDGSVEAVVDGSDQALQSIIAWARIGPRSARVDAVEVSEAAGSFASFEQWPNS
ncbi:MAG: acylphosphatase [Betaproteobacteria bacterium]|nr:acylphosphatase [Betaproteobacteria bacterium]MBI2962072.1 acylphosphatase [Betaproteobacteria bacterium]